MSFQFTEENEKKFADILSRYPNKRAAMLPTLHLAQEQNGFISEEIEAFVAQRLEVPIVDVREVLSFYTLYFRKPMGRHHIRLCMSIACWIRNCDEIKAYLEQKLGVPSGSVTEDGNYSWEAVPDCLGACELAPMLQFDKYFEGNLTREKIDELLDGIQNGHKS
ncbi:MAG TPA: NAD(P)H-dependent oxidoreductase subunit E [Acidobacteriota bacterium]|nr:NAD(P)H-dependent oxidoreductase subunit E [Acidobacteriota bacterium]